MKKVSGIILIILIMLIAVACGIDKNKNVIDKNKNVIDKNVVSTDVSILKRDKHSLVEIADVIIRGTVTSQEVQTDYMGFPATDTFIQVTQVYKGKPEVQVEVRTIGGETNDTILSIDSHSIPSFKMGEDVIVFLTSQKGTRPDRDDFGYYVVGQAQGKFSINNNKSIESESNNEYGFKLNKINKQIKEIMKENEKNPPQRDYRLEDEPDFLTD
ncbi:hypothetical protein [Paenibacillus paeoniae]|uniref:Uncharacterized protein n=1 Tax=Paenibacillus paeoniae TaxID=2292705 RepID=A0A371PG22_9BACL|nr:hypothetical protein [Paenibacillus paeoniae]REK74825.1 hypothetical protein DX130_14295 [Paenibacillus paeoniae]